MRRSLFALVCCLLASPLNAQNYAIVGATVHTMDEQGSMENATVLIRDGKIHKVIAGEAALSGYEIIDGKGKVLTPGLIGASTALGLVEVGMSAGTVDSSAKITALSSTGAAMDTVYGININSSLIAISRIEGITSAATSLNRNGQLFDGQGAIFNLLDTPSYLLKSQAFLSTDVSNSGANTIGGSRAVLWVSLEQAISETLLGKDLNLGLTDEWHGQLTRADIAALAPVVEGKTPLLVDAKRAADIRQVIAFKQRHPAIKLVLVGATEAWLVAKELATNNIPVLLNPESNLPFEFDELAATLENAARLSKAGVRVIIGMETHNIRLARQHAGNAVANGLDWHKGLAALTIEVATIYGIADKVGSLKAGKQADLVLWSGDPLEVTEVAEKVFIQGKLIPMESRQTKLRDRYLNLVPNIPAQYNRP